MKPTASDKLPSVRLPRSGIRAIAELGARRADGVNLLFGEPDFATPPHVVEAAAAAAAAGATRYGPGGGLPSLREALAVSLERRTGLATAPSEVLVTAGAVQAVFGALATLVERDEAVLVPGLSWPNYRGQCALLGRRAVPYPLDPDTLEPDLEQLESLAVATHAKLLIVNSPANPTGVVWGADTVEGCVRVAERHDMWVLSDEVYDEMAFDGVHAHAARFAESGRVVSVFSFSKTYAMTGWRVGYLRAAAPVAEQILKAVELEISCPSTPAQHAALAALSGDQSDVTAMREAYRQRRDLAVELLGAADLLKVIPRGAFYVLVDVRSYTKDTAGLAVSLALRPDGVVCAPGEAFGGDGRGLLRLSLAAAPSHVTEGIRRVIAAVTAEERRPAAEPGIAAARRDR